MVYNRHLQLCVVLSCTFWHIIESSLSKCCGVNSVMPVFKLGPVHISYSQRIYVDEWTVFGVNIAKLGGNSPRAQATRFAIFNFFAPIIILLATIPVSWFLATNLLPVELAFARTGVEAVATVVDRQTVANPDLGEQYLVSLEYLVFDGTTQVAERAVGVEQFEALSVGSQANVIYLPTAPSEIRLGRARVEVILILLLATVLSAGLAIIPLTQLRTKLSVVAGTEDAQDRLRNKLGEMPDALAAQRRELAEMYEKAPERNAAAKAERDSRITESGLPEWAYIATMNSRAWMSLGIWLLVGLLFPLGAYSALGSVMEARSVMLRGESASATVVDRREDSNENADNSRPRCYLTYEFDADPGQGVNLVRQEEHVQKDFYDTQGIGNTTTLRYLPEDPTVVRSDGANGMLLLIIAGMGFLVASIAGWLMVVGSLAALIAFGKAAYANQQTTQIV